MSEEALMLLGLKGKESRHRRMLQLRKNRHDASLEKKARTGRCKQSIQYVKLSRSIIDIKQYLVMHNTALENCFNTNLYSL